MTTQRQCSLGVGCEQAGVCYAEAVGQPDKCGATERCPYCGARVEDPCDGPPADTCEKALAAAYLERGV